MKSLFGFGHRLGYLPFDVGRVVKRPKLKDTLAERILSEGDVFKLFAAAEQPPARRRTPIQDTRARRNYVLLRLLYTAGLRVDEIARLAWRDLRERCDAGQVTAYGKSGKTRVVLLPATVWHELMSIRDGAPADAPPGVRRCHCRIPRRAPVAALAPPGTGSGYISARLPRRH